MRFVGVRLGVETWVNKLALQTHLLKVRGSFVRFVGVAIWVTKSVCFISTF